MVTLSLDYTQAARHFQSRTDYSEAALARCLSLLNLRCRDLVADVGAGTGKLTELLGRRGMHVHAVEPNSAMRQMGEGATRGMPVHWREGRGEATGLDDHSVAAVFYGASFHEMDRDQALLEAERVAHPGGGVCALWNLRDSDDPLLAEIYSTIRQELPAYAPEPEFHRLIAPPYGHPLLSNLQTIEEGFLQLIDRETFLDAFRSSAYLLHLAGEKFQHLLDMIDEILDDQEEIEIPYTTIGWVASIAS